MNNTVEIEKSKVCVTADIVDYLENSVVIKSVLKKSSGFISAISVDSDEGLTEKISPFDNFIQIIDGRAEVIIDGVSNILSTGESIIIPAHSLNSIKPNGRFKMINTLIKTSYQQ